MAHSVQDGWLVGVRAERVPAGGVIKPEMLVIHYTAGSSLDGAVAWWRSPENPSQSSAHVIIDRDGTVVQCIAFTRRANHAGISKWEGLGNINSRSVGIELVNWGVLGPGMFGGGYQSWTKVVVHDAVEVGGRHWQAFPPVQVAACHDVCDALCKAYPIKHLLGHDEIAPERKLDPGQAFPLNHLRTQLGFAAIGGRA